MNQTVLPMAMLLITFAPMFAEDASVRTTIRIDSENSHISFSAERIRCLDREPHTVKGDRDAVLPRKCVLAGNARICISDDVFIKADRLLVERGSDRTFPDRIKGTGRCEWRDSEYTITADHFEMGTGHDQIVFEGNATLIRAGDGGVTRLTADKFSSRFDGQLIAEGQVIIESIDE